MQGFPPIFANAQLATNIFLFVHVLQYRQWILDTDGDTQFQLLQRSPQFYGDPQMKQDILRKKNLAALKLVVSCLSQEDWSWLCEHDAPLLLEYALHNASDAPTRYSLACQCKLSNLIMLHKICSFEARLAEILISIAMYDDTPEKLNWLVNDMRFRCVFSREVPCNDEAWQTIKQSVIEGRLAWQSPKLMPIQVLEHFLPQISLQQRHELFLHNVNDIEFVALLWLPSFEFPTDYLWFQQNPNKNRSWNARFCILRWERILEFVATSRNNLAFHATVTELVSDFLTRRGFNFRECVFRRCFQHNYVHTANKIWELTSTSEQKRLSSYFQHTPLKCTFPVLIDFVFTHILPLLDTNVVAFWFRHALQDTNIVLYDYILANGHFHDDMLPTDVNLNDVVRKRSDFLVALWPTHSDFLLARANKLLNCALNTRNGYFLRFLASLDTFPLDNAILCKYIELLCAEDADVAIRKITNFENVSDQKLAKAYVNAYSIDVVHALYAVCKRIPIREFFQYPCVWSQTLVDTFSFFIDQKAITFADLYHVLNLVSVQNEFVDAFIGKFYADF